MTLESMTDEQIRGLGRTLGIWRGMVSRCHGYGGRGTKDYGERGIAVCDRWRNSYVQFVRDMGPPPDGQSIERIDNDKGYEPGNCRWATDLEQNRNRRVTVYLTIGSVRKTLAEYASEFNIKESTLRARIRSGFTPEQAVGIGYRVNPLTTALTHDGVTLSFKDMAAKHGLTVICLHKRLASGMALADALAKPLETRGGDVSKKLVTVSGETGTVKMFAKRLGIKKIGSVYARMKLGWTIEQALGVAEPPVRVAWNRGLRGVVKRKPGTAPADATMPVGAS